MFCIRILKAPRMMAVKKGGKLEKGELGIHRTTRMQWHVRQQWAGIQMHVPWSPQM